MAARRKEPLWLTRLVVDTIHIEQLREHGGLAGIRDENALESALSRPKNKRVYGQERNLAAFAAAYGFGLVTNHPYVDGNKRVGFLAMLTFLGLNGSDFTATDAEVVTTILQLAAGQVSEEELTRWIQRYTRL